MTKNKNKLIITSLLVLSVASVITYNLIKSKKELTPDKEKARTTIETITLEQFNPLSKTRLFGIIEAEQDTQITGEINGEIARVLVKIGDRVRKGDVLIRIKKEDDLTEIKFQNALQNLNSTKNGNTENLNNISNNLNLAQVEKSSIAKLEIQRASQSKASMINIANGTTSIIHDVLNWTDQLLGVSDNFRNNNSWLNIKIGFNQLNEKAKIKNSTKRMLNWKVESKINNLESAKKRLNR